METFWEEGQNTHPQPTGQRSLQALRAEGMMEGWGEITVQRAQGSVPIPTSSLRSCQILDHRLDPEAAAPVRGLRHSAHPTVLGFHQPSWWNRHTAWPAVGEACQAAAPPALSLESSQWKLPSCPALAPDPQNP